MFRADSSADVNEAKKFADVAREFDIKMFDADVKLKTIDFYYDAISSAIPAADQPTPDEIKPLKLSSGLFTVSNGDRNRADWISYRKCMLSPDQADENDLAEIYANGWGVKEILSWLSLLFAMAALSRQSLKRWLMLSIQPR